jgi:hypothetical protein
MITSLNGRNRSTRLKQNDAGFRHICMGVFPLFIAGNTKQKGNRNHQAFHLYLFLANNWLKY